MTDKQCADILNAVNQRGPIPAEDVKRFIHLAGKWAGIRAASLGMFGADDIKRVTALTFIDGLETFTEFDTEKYEQAVTAQLQSCVDSGLLSAADKTGILALANNKRSRAEALGIPRVKEGHVAEARG